MQQCLMNMMVCSVLPYMIMVAYKYQASVTMCDDSETGDWEEYGGHSGCVLASLCLHCPVRPCAIQSILYTSVIGTNNVFNVCE